MDFYDVIDTPNFCIVLPVYNEESGIAECVERVLKFGRKKRVKFTVVAVNDGSVDGTLSILNSLKRKYAELMVLTHQANLGYGAACRTGFKFAIDERFEYALVMDADGTQDPNFILGFIDKMAEGAMFIKATRYSGTGRVLGVPFSRRAISWLGNKLARVALRTPLTDYTNGFRAIRVDLLQRLTTEENGFAILVEEVCLAKKHGSTFAEVGYTLEARTEAGSVSKFVYSPSVYASYLKYLFKS